MYGKILSGEKETDYSKYASHHSKEERGSSQESFLLTEIDGVIVISMKADCDPDSDIYSSKFLF